MKRYVNCAAFQSEVTATDRNLRAGFFNGTASSFNASYNEQVIEQKESTFFTATLTMRHWNQVEWQKLPITWHQIRNAFDDALNKREKCNYMSNAFHWKNESGIETHFKFT